MNRQTRPFRSGFTLVELLVVLAIIATIAAVTLPALWNAVLRARETRIVADVSQLQMSLDNYKNLCNGYPPDGFNGAAIAAHLKGRFSKHQEGTATSGGALQQLIDANLTPAESLVFWLRDVLKDPRRPLSGSGEPDRTFSEFQEPRLRFTRTITLGTRSVDLHEYIQADGNPAPYVYFTAPYFYLDASNNPVPKSYSNGGGVDVVRPYQSVRPDASMVDFPPNHEWINPTKFQLIAAGLDGEFGADSWVAPSPQLKVFPDGLNYAREEWDNIANFSNEKTFGDNVE